MNSKYENNNKSKQQKIISKCIDNSYETRITSSSKFGWKSEIISFKNLIKYKLFNFNFNRPFSPQEHTTVHFLYKIINPKSEKGMNAYKKNLNKILLMTYRSKYRKQINNKNNSEYNSDCGWGCMIRSSQMIFARMLYKIFKHKYKNQYNSESLIISTIPFFMDDFLILSDIKESDYIILGLDTYIEQLKKYLKEKIEKNQYKEFHIEAIDPPFSIHKICTLGELYGRTCGEWFSDFELPKIYEIINSTFNIIPNLSIMHFNSNIEINIVLEKCFEKEIKDKDPNIFSNDCYINSKKEKFKFKNMGAIFVSVRLGVSEISPEYFPSIKRLFECKEFLGFIGGKADSASYFFGYCNNSLLYLDPHSNQESESYLDEKSKNTYMNKIVYEIEFKSIQCAFTAGFLFRTLFEFTQLLDFFKKFNNDKNKCFHINFDTENKINEELMEKKMNYIDNDENDF